MQSRTFVFILLASALSLGGCKSHSPPATSQNTPSAQNPQQPAGGQSTSQDMSSTAAPAPGSTSAPGAAVPAPGATGASVGANSNPPVAAAPQAPPPPEVVLLPEGTDLRVRLDTDLGSKISQPGDSFSATVADDVMVRGKTVIARGARAQGTVVDAKPLGRFKGGALLSLRLDRVRTKWGSYPVATSSIDRAENGKGKRSAGFIGGGAGLGALIGGLAGGGKGAAIGALAGGGAGTAGSAFTGNKQIVLPAETVLSFRLDHSVHITESSQKEPALERR